MSEIMTPIPFSGLVKWMQTEYAKSGSVFGIRKEKFYKNSSGKMITLFGTKIASPLGPAAGPNSQLTQNIVAAYLAGSRFIELKTVQTMDGEELRKCVQRPCINASDECYNVEWSTELTVGEAFNEYVKAWFLLHLCAKEFELSSGCDFLFNMSVGYSLEGIQSKKIDDYLEGMKNAKNTNIWKECYGYLLEHIGEFKHFKKSDLEAISGCVASSATLSTLHGCPKEEIEKIAHYLITEKNIHTYIKCNPTLLGYKKARSILNEMGFPYISFDEHHFNNDLQYTDAVAMFKRLQKEAAERSLAFGVKITNTFPVQIKRNELPGEEMYMSGRSLFSLSTNVAAQLSNDFDGKLPISYSGGADFFNLADIIQTGIRPVTFATTILKPGGYERIEQLARVVEENIDVNAAGIDAKKLGAFVDGLTRNKRYRKEYRKTGLRKTESELPLFDCGKSPCSHGGCPVNQQIPQYIKKLAEGDTSGAFKIIAIDNAAPSITGTICNHECQNKCTRVDYDDPLSIRAAKKIAAGAEQKAFIAKISAPELKTKKSVGVVGAGPAGVAAALYLRRNGVPVTVYEKLDKPFGIVQNVIPEFRISKNDIELDYQLALKTGVEFKFGVKEDYNIPELKKQHEFIVLATGSWKAGVNPVKEGADKVIDALKFLADSKASGCSLSIGRNIAVIGGGDVAMDCARAAKKNKGVEKVAIVYRRTAQEMPAQHEERALALADGIGFIELCSPESFKNGVLVCDTMKLGEYDAKGRRSVSGTGQKLEMQFDTVIGATGAQVDSSLFAKNGIKLNGRGLPEVNAVCQSSIPDVYIAGDCKAGPATVVKGLADGKTIALDILKKLSLGNDFIKVGVEKLPAADYYFKKGVLAPKQEGPTDGYRCLGCDSVCEICADVCPNRANVAISVAGFTAPNQIVHIDRMCNECGNCAIFCPHAGAPYKDKWTVFASEKDFNESENRGFLPLNSDSFKVRQQDGKVVTWKRGENSISADAVKVIDAVMKEYAYLTV
ncbi:MAG: putative selenate reductase subunit YgfK [Spirochaetaceae bacterium]|nr:putative selenate reductase subunit YgfK [Spirochaetaceae bacterium]